MKAIFGGNRSGKTEEGAEYVITKCLENPNQRWWACAETFPDSRDIQQRKQMISLAQLPPFQKGEESCGGFVAFEEIFTDC